MGGEQGVQFETGEGGVVGTCRTLLYSFSLYSSRIQIKAHNQISKNHLIKNNDDNIV